MKTNILKKHSTGYEVICDFNSTTYYSHIRNQRKRNNKYSWLTNYVWTTQDSNELHNNENLIFFKCCGT